MDDLIEDYNDLIQALYMVQDKVKHVRDQKELVEQELSILDDELIHLDYCVDDLRAEIYEFKDKLKEENGRHSVE